MPSVTQRGVLVCVYDSCSYLLSQRPTVDLESRVTCNLALLVAVALVGPQYPNQSSIISACTTEATVYCTVPDVAWSDTIVVGHYLERGVDVTIIFSIFNLV